MPQLKLPSWIFHMNRLRYLNLRIWRNLFQSSIVQSSEQDPFQLIQIMDARSTLHGMKPYPVKIN
jgi:hypothetical protein